MHLCKENCKGVFMEIRINGKQAALKKGTSFDYVAENRLFSGSDGYTRSITFPLKDCPENIAIFGNINRKDVSKSRVIFDCEIRDRGFYKFGFVTITEITATEVKVQFLEGRSEQNFDTTFDDIFINELDLGTPDGCNDSRPEYAWNPYMQGMKCVALPWVNDGSGNIQNLPDYDKDTGYYSWNKDCRGRSWQPYLLYIAKRYARQRELSTLMTSRHGRLERNSGIFLFTTAFLGLGIFRTSPVRFLIGR